MNTTQAIRARRSIRKYQPEQEIPEEHIRLILEAAMLAPSARNTRPWEFAVVTDRKIREQIVQAHAHAKHLLEASAGIVVCARPDLQENGMEGFVPQDCGAAIENILLQATELGYGTCWCGIYPRRERTEAVRKILGITSVPMAVITIGVAAEEPKARGFYDPERVRFY